jgi:hypothetical protein
VQGRGPDGVGTAATVEQPARQLAPAPTERLPRATIEAAVGDRYQLIRKLGHGGFGVVWLAHDQARDRQVCIKLLWPEHARGFALVRFKREFRTAARLHHPASVAVYELDHAGDLWFFSMEYVPGASLRDSRHLRGDAVATVSIALQILAALDQLHSRAIVHRDIKPHNILLAFADDRPDAPIAKLTDLGIAKVGDLDDDDSVRSLRGSPPYLAPELLLEGVADARCDLYSLGVTLYQTLTGRHPLGQASNAPAWLQRIRHAEPTPVQQVAADVPAPVAEVIMGLIARDPAQRFPSAARAFEPLAAWLAAQPNGALPDLPPLVRGPYLAAPHLVGRRHERTCIDQFLAANLAERSAPQAGPPLLLLSGPAGVGKSRLLAWLLRAAEQHEPRILVGRCRSEIGGPFESVSPILDALRGTPRLGHASASATTTEATADVEQPRTPSTSASASAKSASDSLMATASAGRGLRELLHRLADQLIESVAQQPTLVVLEDVQWGDFETLELLKLWTRSIALHRAEGRTLPVALVATHRPAAAGSPLAELVDQLPSEQRALALDLTALDPAATTELAASLLMTPVDDRLRSLCRRLFADRPVTPLYISQVLRLLLGRGWIRRAGPHGDGDWEFSGLTDEALDLVPATVEEAIGERAGRLSIDTKSLLTTAAVLGRRVTLAAASRAADLDPSLARDCLEEAERAGFVSEPGGEVDDLFVFTHDRLREALYSGLSADQQRHLHGRAATALLELSTERGRDVASDLALHFDRAGDHAQAYRFATLAGRQALRARQYSRASDLYAQAVDHADAQGRVVSRRLLERLGDAAALAVHVDRAQAAYQRAFAETDDPVRQIQLLTRLGELYDRAQLGERATEYYTRGVRLAMPWYLRSPPLIWLAFFVCFPLMLLCPPAATLAFARWLLGHLSPRQRDAVVRCSFRAAARAQQHGSAAGNFHLGFCGAMAGLSDEHTPPRASFAIASAVIQFLFSLLGSDRIARAWADLSRDCQLDTWSDADRIDYSLARGTAALFLADEPEALLHLNRAFTLATARKDPLLMETAGVMLAGGYRWFAHSESNMAVVLTLHRMAQSEGLHSLETLTLMYQGMGAYENYQPKRALDALAEFRRRADAMDEEDAFLDKLTGYFEIAAESLVVGPSVDIFRRALDLLDDCDRKPMTIPTITIGGLTFATASAQYARLAARGQAPRALEQRLARARRRLRLAEGYGRWRRPIWLMGFALHDAARGRPAPARRQLEAAFRLFRRYGTRQYHIKLSNILAYCLAPDHPLAVRTRQELDDLCETDPRIAPYVRDQQARLRRFMDRHPGLR